MTVSGQITIHWSAETAPTEEQHAALIAALEFIFGARNEAQFGEVSGLKGDGPLFGYAMDGLSLYMEPESLAEWRRVALSKWRHYKEMCEAYEVGARSVGGAAFYIHSHSLAKLVPYLLGHPEEALEEPETLREKVANREAAKITSREEASEAAFNAAYGGPHHHEERLSEYPAESLDFGDDGRTARVKKIMGEP